MPIALLRFFDKIIFGLDRASSYISSIVLLSINSDDASRTEDPELTSDITIFPPLLSSDIALSILTVKVIIHFNYYILKIRVISVMKQNI